MRIVNIHEAKTHFSKLIDSVSQGEVIVIAMAGKPVAKLTPLESAPKRRFGFLKGKVKISKDFDSPLPEDLLSEFED